MRGRWRAGDDGVTLVELLCALAIIGVAFSALLGAMFALEAGSGEHAEQADGAGYIRAYAEGVQAAPYQSCATSYPSVGFSLPTGWTATQSVQYGAVAPNAQGVAAVAWSGTCVPGGLQVVHVTVADGSGDSEALDVVKRQP